MRSRLLRSLGWWRLGGKKRLKNKRLRSGNDGRLSLYYFWYTSPGFKEKNYATSI